MTAALADVLSMFQTALHDSGFQTVEDFQSAVDKLTLSVQRAKSKNFGVEEFSVQECEVFLLPIGGMWDAQCPALGTCLVPSRGDGGMVPV